jgi:hypothetical protein
MTRITALLAAAALLACAAPTLAGDEPEISGTEFVMPSRNVACLVQDVGLEGGSEQSKRLYCIRKSPTLLAVILDERGLESYQTDGDSQFNWNAPILNYGDNWFHEGFSCDSAKTGLVCSHSDYGAFEVSRKGVKQLR